MTCDLGDTPILTPPCCPPHCPPGTPTSASDAAAGAKRQIPGVPTLPQSKFLSQPNPLQQKQAAATAAAAAAGGQLATGPSSSSGSIMGLPPQQATLGGPGMGLPPLSPMTPTTAPHHGHHGHPHHDHDHAAPSTASVAAAAAAAAAKILLQRRRVSGYEMEKDLARWETVWGWRWRRTSPGVKECGVWGRGSLHLQGFTNMAAAESYSGGLTPSST